MLDIHMFSSATKVKGQGVGSAYLELIRLLEEHHADSMKVSINKFGKADISHYHTIDPLFYLSTMRPGHGTRIGYVHFLKIKLLISRILFRQVNFTKWRLLRKCF